VLVLVLVTVTVTMTAGWRWNSPRRILPETAAVEDAEAARL
jgi:hypothetical protein